MSASLSFKLGVLTIVLICLHSSSSGAANGLVTTEDDAARVEEAAEQIDSDEYDQNDSDYNASNGACSKSCTSASSNFGFNCKEKNWPKKFLFPIEKEGGLSVADTEGWNHSNTTFYTLCNDTIVYLPCALFTVRLVYLWVRKLVIYLILTLNAA